MGKVLNMEAWKRRLELTKQGKIACNALNIVTVMENAPELRDCVRYDTFGKRFIVRKLLPWGTEAYSEWTDEDMGELLVWLQNHEFEIQNESTVIRAVSVVATRNRFNPLQDHLNGLRWDGVKRIHAWLVDYLGAEDSTYIRTVGRKFLVAAVARGLDPGCKVDTALVLEGPQGNYKSTAVLTLAGADWYTDDIGDISNKDSILQLQGKWLIEIAEMTSFKRADIEKVKAYISRKSDRLRPPYQKNSVDWQRQCAMVITTNDSHYLKDSTGNRRFWPVYCTTVDIKGLEDDRDQLWAEAVTAYNAGEKWWLNSEEEKLTVTEQDARMEDDTWLSEIANFVESRSTVTTATILTQCIDMNLSQAHAGHGNRVGDCMRRLGWDNRRVRRMEFADKARVKKIQKDTYEWRRIEEPYQKK
jgi:putative DNA primase/helicase